MLVFGWTSLCSLLVLAQAAFAVFPLSEVKKLNTLPIATNKFIVEVESSSAFGSKRSVSTHGALYSALRARDIGYTVDKEFNSEGIFVGAAVTLNNTEDVSKVASTDGVKAIRPIRTFARPNPVQVHVVSGLDDPELPPDHQSTHTLTGVDKLHARGILGSGINVGIIDTGIDYTHPALGGGFGPGFKVIGGFDLVGDDYTGDNEPVPDPDPLDQCAGHGTHVAGIIGANPDNGFNISGVAYEASLSSYRVFGCEGFTTDDVIVDALLLGFQEGQDILTLSLGGADGWTETSAAVVASRLVEAGKVVTISAGNDGASGSWYTSSPANGINVISVASLDNTEIPLQTATVNGADHDPIPYFELFPFPVTDPLPIFATSNDTTVVDDACNPLPDTTPDLSDSLVVVRRGTCTFVQKMTNIAAKNGTLAFIYDNGSGFAAIDVGNFNATLIQASDGQFLVNQFVAGVPITVSFPQSGGIIGFPDPAGGLISSFTSYGPTNDFFFKPAIATPGGNILSTLPVLLGSFGIESGTSMAAPFAAGSAALLLAVKGLDIASAARSIFESTAQVVPSSHTDGDPLQTVTQQGAGLINVFNALFANSTVSPAELVLNDTAHFNDPQTFTVTNVGPESQDYTLSHVPAGTAVTVQPNSISAALGPVPLTTDAATVSFSTESFILAPGESQTITVDITLPDDVETTTFPVFSGFINVATGSEALHVTYLGLVGSLIDKQVLDDTNIFFGFDLPALMNGRGQVQAGTENYTWIGQDFPSVLWRQVFGTPLFRVDLVDVGTTLQSRAEPLLSFSQAEVAGPSIIGSLFEVDFLTRNNEGSDNPFNLVNIDTPTFANGTTIPNGSYRFLVRSLRVTGDPENEEDFESWVSPIVGINA